MIRGAGHMITTGQSSINLVFALSIRKAFSLYPQGSSDTTIACITQGAVVWSSALDSCVRGDRGAGRRCAGAGRARIARFHHCRSARQGGVRSQGARTRCTNRFRARASGPPHHCQSRPRRSAERRSHYDLPIALGLMAAIGAIPHDALSSFTVLGELGATRHLRRWSYQQT
jgi:hypothetical protein